MRAKVIEQQRSLTCSCLVKKMILNECLLLPSNMIKGIDVKLLKSVTEIVIALDFFSITNRPRQNFTALLLKYIGGFNLIMMVRT